MLDLERLFAASPAPAAVTGGTATAPADSDALKTAESLEPWGIAPNQQHSGGGEVGHTGHSGNGPVSGQVCPRKPLPHKALDGLGTVVTLVTVDFQGGKVKWLGLVVKDARKYLL